MARKKRNKSKCNINGVSSNVSVSEFEDTMPSYRDCFDRDRDFVCTGEPGTGFFKRKQFSLEGTFPVPISYAAKYINIRTEYDHKMIPKPAGKPDSDDEFCIKIIIYLLFVIGSILFGNPIVFLIVFFGPFVYLSGRIIYSWFRTEDSGPKKKEPESRYEEVIVPYKVVDFNIPAIRNVDEYYIREGERVSAALDDGLHKTIIENFVSHLRDAGRNDGFVADSLVPATVLRNGFASVCSSFESLILDTVVHRLDYITDDDAELPDMSVSEASLYVGAFDFIGTRFDVPVLDLRDFRIFIYPSFVIKAYDALAFDVIAFDDFELSNKKCVYKHSDYTCITMEFGGGRYSVLASNIDRAVDFVESLRGYVERFRE